MTENTMGTANTVAKLKEGFNKAFLVGTLVEKNIESKPYTNNTTGETVERLMGTISIRTAESEVHQVRLRQNKMKRAGGENALYKALETINNEYVSVADFADGSEKLSKLNSIKSEAGDTILYSYKELLKVLNKASFDFHLEASNGGIMKVSELNKTYSYDVQFIENDGNQEPLYKVALDPTQLSVQGSITNNEYYGADGQLRQYQQIEGLFVNRLREQDDATPRATFEVEVFVKNVVPEMDGDDETGRAIVNAWIPTYSAVIPYKFSTIPEGADFFLNDVEPNSTLKVYGKIVNRREKHIKQVPSGFGAPIEEVTFSFTTESLIMNASLPYEEEDLKRFKPELVKEALVAREVRLEQGRTRASASGQPSGAGMNAFGGAGGFGGNGASKPVVSEAEKAGVDLSGLF